MGSGKYRVVTAYEGRFAVEERMGEFPTRYWAQLSSHETLEQAKSVVDDLRKRQAFVPKVVG
jgi:hypothetical protein